MSIDAVISRITPDGDDLILDLIGREPGHGPGQASLRITNYTFVPAMGQAIWGGSGSCIIEPSQGVRDQKLYKRIGYIQLVEDFGKEEAEAGISQAAFDAAFEKFQKVAGQGAFLLAWRSNASRVFGVEVEAWQVDVMLSYLQRTYAGEVAKLAMRYGPEEIGGCLKLFIGDWLNAP